MNLTIELPQQADHLVLRVVPQSPAPAMEGGAAEYDSWTAGVAEYDSWSGSLPGTPRRAAY